MTHPHLMYPLSESATIISNVFSSCRDCLLDLEESEHMTLATAVAGDMIESMIARSTNEDDLRTALTTISERCSRKLDLPKLRSADSF